jgi:hypothetical protein
MDQFLVTVKTFASVSLAALLLAWGTTTLADDPPSLGAIKNHDHAPIVVQSRPVIERLPVKVISPIDLQIAKTGHIFVADEMANCVFRLDPDGEVSLPVDRLQDIRRIHVDDDGNLYTLTSDARESQIRMTNPVGQSVVLHDLKFDADSFVRDSVGQFMVSSKDSNRIFVISNAGEVAELTQVVRPVSDLVLNAGGQAEALLTSGEIVHIAASGEVTATGFAPAGSSRLMRQPDGSMLALSKRSNGQTYLSSISRDETRPKDFSTFATVPEGTQAVGFDSLGNLCLANPDLRAITKVTSHFRIPCPHCGRPTEMIFRKDVEPASDPTTRRF